MPTIVKIFPIQNTPFSPHPTLIFSGIFSGFDQNTQIGKIFPNKKGAYGAPG
jgi:hypothetical protein